MDSSNQTRFSEVRTELRRLFYERELKGIPIIVYANKQDLQNALPASFINDYLNEEISISSKDLHIFPCSAKTGDGLFEGLNWILSHRK